MYTPRLTAKKTKKECVGRESNPGLVDFANGNDQFYH
jgi:hypothetical protein